MAEHSVSTSGLAPEPRLTLMHEESQIDFHQAHGWCG